MKNGKLDAMGTVSLDGVPHSVTPVTSKSTWLDGIAAAFQRFDGWAQRYFNAQAGARSRQNMTCHCDW